MDKPAFEFRRSYQIMDRARKLAMEHLSKEKIGDAGRPPLHRYRTWTSGHGVLVWRTARGRETFTLDRTRVGDAEWPLHVRGNEESTLEVQHVSTQTCITHRSWRCRW